MTVADAPGEDPAAAALARVRSGSRKRGDARPEQTPVRFSTARPDGRDPQRLGDGVTDWARRNGHETRLAVAALTAQWPAIVGDDVAQHAKVGEFDDGKLTVLVDSPEGTLQLRYLARRIRQRIDDEIGPGLVTAVEVRGPGNRRTPGRWRVRTGRRSPRPPPPD